MQKRTPEIKAFIREHADLFWYIPDNKKEDISDETLVEFILNYGTLDDVKEMKELLGNKYIFVGEYRFLGRSFILSRFHNLIISEKSKNRHFRGCRKLLCHIVSLQRSSATVHCRLAETLSRCCFGRRRSRLD